MKTVTIKLMARDEVEAKAIDELLLDSQVMNNWPCFQWQWNESTEQEVEWFDMEYGEELHIDE